VSGGAREPRVWLLALGANLLFPIALFSLVKILVKFYV